MAANNALKITDINFDSIKSNLKDYLSSQSELKDYDYESSTVQTIMNLLSYNTYYNSIYLNMVANEMFLDSAQKRSNVVSRAKQVGYTSRSARGATATIKVSFSPLDTPDLISIPADTEFTTNINDISYTFSNPIAVSVAPVGGLYVGTVNVVEGTAVQESYTVDSTQSMRYVLNNKNADTTTLKVSIQESVSNTTITSHTLNTNFTSVTASTKAYFLQEQEDEKFEVYFGDGVLGKRLKDGNIVRLNYKVSSGDAPNNANSFSSSSNISGYSPTSIVATSRAAGGASIESIDSIKLNAPNNYSAQNRAITTSDYKSLILSQYGDIQSVSVWGGEDNTPPQYGRVYIAAKPKSGLLLSQDTKNSIVTYLADKKSITVEPIVVDASYLYVKPTVDVKFDPDSSPIDAGTLATTIKTAIVKYESKNLGLFNNAFIRSELIKKVDATSDAITSVDIALELSQRFIPQSGVITTYTFNFNHPLLNITAGSELTIVPEKHPGQGLALFSSTFTFAGYTNTEMDDDGFGNVRFFSRNTSGTKVYLNRRAGTINYDSGQVILSAVSITGYTNNFIEVRVVPRLSDIDPIRSQLILLSDASVRVYDNNISRITASVTNISLNGDGTEVQEYATVYTSY